MKKYLIEKGKHSAKGLHFGLTFKKQVTASAMFGESCLYNIDDNDKYDINKLFGFSTTWFHHRQSARIGWRCINGKTIEIHTYTYSGGKRVVETTLLCEVHPNEKIFFKIEDLESSYRYSIRKENGEFYKTYVPKHEDWFVFHYYLFPYFGGNKTAPHDMEIFLDS